MSDSDTACRADVWLWRARFAKTRSVAVALIERGMVRLTHHNQPVRLDKPGRALRPGDVLTLALQQGVVVVRIESVGTRRGPAEEARTLYTVVG
jgi:ribosome-associated heat shock protein Hsp15